MKKTFYHVVTERPMSLGQEIIFDENNHSGVYERIYKEKEKIDKIYNKEKVEITDDISKALREFALEEIRQKEFSNYPSRLSCLYASNTQEEAEFWYNIFIEQKRPTFQIVKLEVDGPSFTGDAWNCFKGTEDITTNYSLARDYWNNKNNKKGEKPIYETLISGRIKVIEIIKENKIDLDKYSK
jgi:hypothetical protein